MRPALVLGLLFASRIATAQPEPEPPPIVEPGTGAAPPPVAVAAPAPPPDATDEALAFRLRLLEQDLTILDAAGSGSARLVNGIASLVLGGVFVSLGALLSDETLAGTGPGASDAADDIRGIFFVFGGLSIADGLLTLLFIPSLGDSALDFQAMPVSPRRAALAKMRFGERALRDYADQSRTDRLVNGIGGTALGLIGLAAMVTLFDITPDNNPVFFYILVAVGAIQVIGGVIEIVTPSRAERMWEAYRRTMIANPVRRRSSGVSFVPGFAPAFAPSGRVTGGTATLGLRY